MVTLLLCMRCATESRLQLPLHSIPCLWLLQLATDPTSGATAAGYMMPEYGPQQDEDDYEEDPDFSGEDLALGGEPDETTLRRMLHGPPQQQDLALQYMRQRLNGGGCLAGLKAHVGSRSLNTRRWCCSAGGSAWNGEDVCHSRALFVFTAVLCR